MQVATKATTKKARAPKKAPRVDLQDREPTTLHSDFAEYIQEETGYEADLKSVQLATLLRMDFQKSEKNQARIQASREAKAEALEERARKKAEREEKRAAKEAAKAEKSTKAPAAKKAPAKKAAAKKAAAKAPTRRRAAKPKATEEEF